MPEQLPFALAREQHRVRELIKEYKAIGPSGNFCREVLKRKLANAESAIESGDLKGMCEAYIILKGCK